MSKRVIMNYTQGDKQLGHFVGVKVGDGAIELDQIDDKDICLITVRYSELKKLIDEGFVTLAP
jgi:hypothetical protein